MLHWLPFIIYFLINCYLLWHSWQQYRLTGQRVTLVATFIYLTAILVLCLTPTLFSVASAHKQLFYFAGTPYNAIPFQGISPEFFLNIIMTFPWGVFLYLFNRHRSWQKVILYSFALSLFIEANQFIWDLLINLGRLADIDDLITNTIGAIIGFAVMYLLDKTILHRLITHLCLK